MKLKTLLTPAELPALVDRDLTSTCCVVFDVLRATSTFVTALHHGADAIIPVCEIAEARAIHGQHPDYLLAGERNGMKIRGATPADKDFALGNSPREFTRDLVQGRTIVSTTTNGTRALRACRGARTVLAGSFLNLTATARFIHHRPPETILLVCAGTGDEMALEDVMAAGALTEVLLNKAILPDSQGEPAGHACDATEMARQVYVQARENWPAVLQISKNARRLLGIPELHDDVAFCARLDLYPLVAGMTIDGSLRRL